MLAPTAPAFAKKLGGREERVSRERRGWGELRRGVRYNFLKSRLFVFVFVFDFAFASLARTFMRRGGRTVELSKERVGGVREEDLEEEEEEVFMWVRMLEVIARRVLGEG